MADATLVCFNSAAAYRNFAHAEFAMAIGLHASGKYVAVAVGDFDDYSGSFYCITCRIQHFTGNCASRVVSRCLGFGGWQSKGGNSQHQEQAD